MHKTDLIQYSKIHKLFKPFYGGIGHVLMLHRVCNENDYLITRGLQVSQAYLDGIIKFFISSKIDIVTLDECYERINTRGKVKQFVAFTFDDGYADNLTHALPVFEKYNAPFTVFLSTGFPDHKVVLWWYLLEDLIMNNARIEFSYQNEKYAYNTVTLKEKTETLWKIRRFILNSNQDDFFNRLSMVFNKTESQLFELTKKLALTWDQVTELSNHSLATIGAHTVNHFALSRLTKERVAEEITNSVRIIEGKTGKPVYYFAYPIGTSAEAGDREFDIAKKCNIRMAFSAEKGNIFKYHAKHLHSLPRIGINEKMRISHLDLYINGLIPLKERIFG